MLKQCLFALLAVLVGSAALAQGGIGDGASPTPTLPPPTEGEDADPLLEMPGAGATSAPRFEVLDANRDGRLTRSEITDRPDLDAQFDGLDRDRNQSLTRNEFTRYSGGAERTRFGQLDGDGDGRISRTEASDDARVAIRFAGLDRNRDGTLSIAEFAAFEADADAQAEP